jgi:hypothetical protein
MLKPKHRLGLAGKNLSNAAQTVALGAKGLPVNPVKTPPKGLAESFKLVCLKTKLALLQFFGLAAVLAGVKADTKPPRKTRCEKGVKAWDEGQTFAGKPLLTGRFHPAAFRCR